jgi:hypothetical protein
LIFSSDTVIDGVSERHFTLNDIPGVVGLIESAAIFFRRHRRLRQRRSSRISGPAPLPSMAGLISSSVRPS